MSALFSKPKMPAPIEQPPAPVVDQGQLDRNMSDALKRRRGRASTDLTSGGPSGSTAGAVGAKSLLGS